MGKKEFKIGEVFQCGLVKLKVEPARNFCSHCFLNNVCDDIDHCRELVGECLEEFREDNTSVIFIKINE